MVPWLQPALEVAGLLVALAMFGLMLRSRGDKRAWLKSAREEYDLWRAEERERLGQYMANFLEAQEQYRNELRVDIEALKKENEEQARQIKQLRAELALYEERDDLHKREIHQLRHKIDVLQKELDKYKKSQP